MLCLALAIPACQTMDAGAATVAVDGRLVHVQTRSRVPSTILRGAGIQFKDGDEVSNLGYEIDPNEALPLGEPISLDLRRPVSVFLNGAPFETVARTVGEALSSTGLQLYAADSLEPPANEPVTPGLGITYLPSAEVSVQVDRAQIQLRGALADTASVLAEGGLPLMGLDVASLTQPVAESVGPNEWAISRISESLILVQEPIPYETRAEQSAEVELGLEQVLEPGRGGLAVARTRIRYRDGVEDLRTVEPRAVVRPPQDRIVVQGTRVVEKTASVDGQTIKFWYTMQMYATIYSPCNSATDSGSCSTGTASGLKAGKGVVAVDPDMFAYLNGQQLYIPGYGYAVVGDVGGGYIIEQNLGISRYKWIDLGFDDNNIQDMGGWITVYFLAPAPSTIPSILN